MASLVLLPNGKILCLSGARMGKLITGFLLNEIIILNKEPAGMETPIGRLDNPGPTTRF